VLRDKIDTGEKYFYRIKEIFKIKEKRLFDKFDHKIT